MVTGLAFRTVGPLGERIPVSGSARQDVMVSDCSFAA